MNHRGGGTIISAVDTVAGDLCFYDIENDKKILVAVSKFDASQFPISKYYPLGVVVIPGSHDVYGTGECAIISLNWMDCNNPNNGGEHSCMYWGPQRVVDSIPTNMHGICLYSLASNDSNIYNDTSAGTNSYGGFPYTYNKHLADPVYIPTGINMDKTAYYNRNDKMIPSPYLNNGGRNPIYHLSQFYSSDGYHDNVFSDFSSRAINDDITTNEITSTTWKTSSKISNRTTMFPIFACAWRYCPTGTNQGDWYVPTVAEGGYFQARNGEIITSLNLLKTVYNIGSSFNVDDATMVGFWTCSGTSTQRFLIEFAQNGVYGGGNIWTTSPSRADRGAGRAFLRVS